VALLLEAHNVLDVESDEGQSRLSELVWRFCQLQHPTSKQNSSRDNISVEGGEAELMDHPTPLIDDRDDIDGADVLCSKKGNSYRIAKLKLKNGDLRGARRVLGRQDGKANLAKVEVRDKIRSKYPTDPTVYQEMEK
jgi:hypothetical protein